MRGEHRKDRTWMIALGGILFVLLIFGAVWWNWMNAPPVVHVPTPKVPKPNARDYYTAAGNAIVDSAKIGFAIANIPKSQSRPTSPTDPDRWYSLEEKEAIVKHNAKALAKLRQGFAYECLAPPIRSYQTLYPSFAKFRELGRLLQLEAQVRVGAGNWSGSMDSCLDAQELGSDVPRGGCLIDGLVGIAIQNIGRVETWKAVDHLSGVEARKAAGRLESINASRISLAAVLQEEKWFMQAAIAESMQSTNWFALMITWVQFGSSGRSGSASYTKLPLYSKRGMLRAHSQYMDRVIAYARQPYASKAPLPPVPKDPLNQAMAPTFTKARLVFVKTETQNALLMVALALRAYKQNNGQYPVSLSQLAPGYLKKLPADPFALKGTLRYKHSGQKYVLYSLGPDGKDDGGKAIDNGKYAQDKRYHVDESSKGDVVAGVNTR